MKQIIIAIALVIPITTVGAGVFAGDPEWRCQNGGGNAICNVIRVRFNPVYRYVEAKIERETDYATDCNYVCFRYGYGASSIEEVRAVESLMQTALVTGLFVSYEVMNDDDTDGYCHIQKFETSVPE
jgi:hypothetical protein